jgi:hypothetical protein
MDKKPGLRIETTPAREYDQKDRHEKNCDFPFCNHRIATAFADGVFNVAWKKSGRVQFPRVRD